MIIETEKYNFEESLSRIDQMLSFQITEDEVSSSVPTLSEIPTRGGNITYCSVMHIVINSSSGNNSQMVKLHRAFLSETIAILSSDNNCIDAVVLGNSLTAVFTTPFKINIEQMIDKSAMINTLAQIVSKKAKDMGLPSLSVRIGIDYGKAILMRLGKLNTAEINPKELVWMGKPIDGAMKLSETPEHSKNIWISSIVYQNLSEEYTKFFHHEVEWGCYGADIINTHMKSWLNKQ